MTINITASELKHALLGWAAEKSHETGVLWTHAYIAHKAGIQETVVLRMLLGTATPDDSRHIPVIAAVFGTTPSKLLGR